MVHEDSRGRSSSYCAAQGEECDNEDVVTAHVADSYKKSSGWQDSCRKRRLELCRGEQHHNTNLNVQNMMGACLNSALPNIQHNFS